MYKLLIGAMALLLSCQPGAAGGGTDGSARLLAQFVGPQLPGSPTIVVRNVPGADGMTSLNYFVQQVAADGLTTAMGSSTQSDPHFYRNPNAKYDPARFRIVGGVGRGGTTLIIRKDAIARLPAPSRMRSAI